MLLDENVVETCADGFVAVTSIVVEAVPEPSCTFAVPAIAKQLPAVRV